MVWFGLVWFGWFNGLVCPLNGLVLFGLVWSIGLVSGLVWTPTVVWWWLFQDWFGLVFSFGSGLVWFGTGLAGLVWFGLFGLVWFGTHIGLVWFGLPSWFGLVWFGLVTGLV